MEQANLLAELTGGGQPLLSSQRPCSLAELMSFRLRHGSIRPLWEQLCGVWESAARALATYRGCPDPINFPALMDAGVAELMRKPTRIRSAPFVYPDSPFL